MNFTALYLQRMENIITSLKIRCVKAGTNLTKVCEAAGVDRDIVTRWQKEEPRSFQIYRRLDKALKQLELETAAIALTENQNPLEGK